jgi:hypothetical protein
MNAHELSPAIKMAVRNGIKVTLSLSTRPKLHMPKMNELELFSDMTIQQMTEETFRVLGNNGIGGNEELIQFYKRQFNL